MYGMSAYKDLILISRAGQEFLYCAERPGAGPVLLRTYGNAGLAAAEYGLIGNGAPEEVLRPVEAPAPSAPGLLALEHCQGSTLHSSLGSGPLNLQETRGIGSAIAKALGKLHNAGILHLALNPKNILISSAAAHGAATELRLTGLGHGRRLYSADGTIEPDDYPVEFLEYLAPELYHSRSGRVGPACDYFSLGTILYRMLTGLPANPAASVPGTGPRDYSAPPEARLINPKVPAALSDLVTRLLDPDPTGRPAGAGTIIGILEHPIGKRSTRVKPTAADGPSGRNKEQARLLHALDSTAAGSSDFLMVAGSSGIGKTFLVSRILSQASDRIGLGPLYGKFEMDSQIPYLAYSQAMAGLGNEVLRLPIDEADSFRKQAREAFSDLPQEAIAAFPELSALLGTAGVAAEKKGGPFLGSTASSKERRNLIQGLLVDLMELCAAAHRPAVLFIDDLQWADRSSMEILIRLVRARIPGLLVVCAYRDTEISGSDAHADAVSELRVFAGNSGCLDLAPLGARSLGALAKRRLPGLAPAEVAELGRFLFGRTGGNPFYCTQIIEELKASRHLRFDHIDERWSYHQTPQAAGVPVAPDAVRFLVERMKKVSALQRSVLAAAACSGRSILPGLIAEALGVSEGVAVEAAEALAGQGFFSRSIQDGRLRFSHDNVRHAAHGMAEAQEEASLHLRLGRLLRSRSEPLTPDELFDAAEHGNEGSALTTERDELFQIAAVDLSAAGKAKESGAFSAAYRYILAALACVPSDAWEDRYDLMLALHREAAETAFLSGDHSGMEVFISAGLEKCRNLFEELPFAEIRINAYMARFQMAEIVDLYVRTLRRLGFKLVQGSDGAGLGIDASLTRGLLAIFGLKRFSRPQNTDRRSLAALRIMSTGFSAVYLADRSVYAMACSAMLRLTLRCGDSPWTAFALVAYASSITFSPGRIKGAVLLADFALESARRNKLASLQARLNAVAYLFVKPWADGFLEALAPLREGFSAGLKYGDYDNAGLCCTVYCSYNILYGPNLPTAEREAAEYERILVELRQDRSIAAVRRHRQLALNLLGRSLGPGPVDFSGPCFDERTMGPMLEAAADSSGSVSYRCYMLFLAYLFGDYERAVRLGESIAPKAEAVGNQAAIIGLYLLFYPLSLAASRHAKTASGKVRIPRAAEACRLRLRRLSAAAPKAYGPWNDLVEAEFASEEGDHAKAERLYFRAVGGADELGYMRDRALFRERLALSCERSGKSELARLHLQEACELYRQWGAEAKVRRLQEDYPWLESLGIAHTEDGSTDARALEAFADALKRIRAAGTEDSIAEAAAEGVLRITGADFAIVLIRRRDGPGLALRSRLLDTKVRTEPTPAEEIPERFSAYALHTGRTLALDGPQADPAVLCVPIRRAASFAGILYAEHRGCGGVFTRPKIAAVEQLGVQASESFMELLRSRLDSAEEELRRQVLLAGKLADLGRRTVGVVHELNNPNHVIGLGVDRIEAELRKLLVEQEDAGLPPSIQGQAAIEAALRDIRAASGRVDALIRDIKEIGGGKQELIPADINEAVKAGAAMVGADGPGLVLDLADSLPPIAGNVRKLQQIVINLAENGIQASVRSGTPVRVATRKEKGHVVLEVSDEGEGIAPEHMAKIRSPFFTTRREKGGTGLGLAIVEDLVRLHKGRMEITSRPGFGTRATVFLPIPDSDAEQRFEGEGEGSPRS